MTSTTASGGGRGQSLMHGSGASTGFGQFPKTPERIAMNGVWDADILRAPFVVRCFVPLVLGSSRDPLDAMIPASTTSSKRFRSRFALRSKLASIGVGGVPGVRSDSMTLLAA